MKKTTLFLLVQFIVLAACSQKMRKPAPTPIVKENRTISKVDLVKLHLLEDTLADLAYSFTADTLLQERKKSCYSFIPKLVNALKADNSFYYPFDSLETVAKVYAPDSSFRIFTWQLVLPGGKFRYYGVMQMKSTKMKIFPLFDSSDTMTYHTQRVTSNNNWYGALYYNIVMTMAGKKAVYTIFGFEGADYITRRKVLEILTFDESRNPKFGAPLFYIQQEEDTAHYKRNDTLHRFFIEYKYSASTVLNYDPAMQMIVFDHVTPPNEKAKGATFSYIPDGTYEGFKWQNDRWNWIPTVFTFAINEMDNPPIPAPLFGVPARQPELPKEGPK
jgi:hypothetical protein